MQVKFFNEPKKKNKKKHMETETLRCVRKLYHNEVVNVGVTKPVKTRKANISADRGHLDANVECFRLHLR